MFGEHSAIGNTQRDILLLGIITLQHVIQNICRGFNGALWWYGPLSEDQFFFITKLPKLSCGFKYSTLIT